MGSGGQGEGERETLSPGVSRCVPVLTNIEHVNVREGVEGLGRQDVSVGEENVVLLQLPAVHTALIPQQP